MDLSIFIDAGKMLPAFKLDYLRKYEKVLKYENIVSYFGKIS